jgi:DNA-nicking Smr family endonuclease
MARRKKPRLTGDEAERATAPRPAPEKLNRPFADALRDLKARAVTAPAAPPPAPAKPPPPAERPAPSPREAGPAAPRGRSAPLADYSYEDRAAFNQAFAGVRPLASGARRLGGQRADRRSPPPPDDRDAREEEARRRLERLVAGEVRFEIHRDDDGAVRGQRRGAHPSHLRALESGVTPQATLDLHGLSGEAAGREVGRFVREHHRKGERVLLVVHGKGRHSEGALGVLQDRVLEALTKGGAAACVVAFRTAPERLGGLGALVVRLAER